MGVGQRDTPFPIFVFVVVVVLERKPICFPLCRSLEGIYYVVRGECVDCRKISGDMRENYFMTYVRNFEDVRMFD